jgi:ubiquinone/menaquinone biosynthesis C-methylase UbiE
VRQLSLPRLARRRGVLASVRHSAAGARTAVDRYWTDHTVTARQFKSPRQSEKFLEWRFQQYPLFREFSGLWGEHDGEVILDYGCGPGNDLTGFALYTGARRIIGFDVSPRALELARDRLALHQVDPGRVELIEGSDSTTEIPLEDASVDYLQSQGVLHHTSDPEAILRELHRVLRPDGRGSIMVYHRDSVWFHLYTAYEKAIVEGTLAGLDPEEAFRRNTDGPECPISRCYTGEQFSALCRAAGFEVEFLGGYLSKTELASIERAYARALADDRLPGEHRAFLRSLTFDFAGRPMIAGSHAGIGGAYRLRKR